MKIISFVTQKGGSGKTTLTINCAVAAFKKNEKVLILDMDAQGTAENWYQDRENENPKLVKITGNDLEKALELALKQNFDWVMIDTPGRDEPSQAAAIRVSDFCLIPCRPSPADMKATPPTAETIRRLGKNVSFVLTQTPPRSYRIREAERGLSVLGTVCPVPIVLRNAYQDAQGLGLGVIEFEPNGRAAKEITELWQWIVKKIGKVSYGKEKNVA
jgi:chromosome partitioning protein